MIPIEMKGRRFVGSTPAMEALPRCWSRVFVVGDWYLRITALLASSPSPNVARAFEIGQAL